MRFTALAVLLLLLTAGNPNHGRKLPADMAMYYLGVTPLNEPLPVGVPFEVRGCGFDPGTAHIVDHAIVGVDEWVLLLGNQYQNEGDVIVNADGCMDWMYCAVRHNPSDRDWTENHELLTYQQVRNRTVLKARLAFDVFSYFYENQSDNTRCIVHFDQEAA